MNHPSLAIESNGVRYEVGMIVTYRAVGKDYIITKVSSKTDADNLTGFDYVMVAPVNGVVIDREDPSAFSIVRSKLSLTAIEPKKYTPQEMEKHYKRLIDESLDVGDKDAFIKYTTALASLKGETAND